MWMIYIAVSVDLLSDGILIGTGSVVSASMALVLALGQGAGGCAGRILDGRQHEG
jgi:hypothetical protein